MVNPLSQKKCRISELFCLARPSQKVQIGHHKSHHSGKPIYTLFSRPIHKKYRSANQTNKKAFISTKQTLFYIVSLFTCWTSFFIIVNLRLTRLWRRSNMRVKRPARSYKRACKMQRKGKANAVKR